MLSGNKELIVNNLEKLFDNHIETVQALYPLIPNIETFAKRVNRCLAAGGKVLWMGNGGSAADSQHLAAELVGRFLLVLAIGIDCQETLHSFSCSDIFISSGINDGQVKISDRGQGLDFKCLI